MVPELSGAPETTCQDFTGVLIPQALSPSSFLCILRHSLEARKRLAPLPHFFFFLEGKTTLDKISHTTLKETQNPNSQRLSTYSRRSSAQPHPTPSQGGKESIKPALDTWIGKPLFLCWRGRLKQVLSGRERKARGHGGLVSRAAAARDQVRVTGSPPERSHCRPCTAWSGTPSTP